jgi:ribosomal protein L21E
MKKGKTQAEEFCSCIKKVKKSLRNQNRKNRIIVKNKKLNNYEKGGIAICVKSVLQSKGRTLKKFHCKKTPMLKTQKLLQ